MSDEINDLIAEAREWPRDGVNEGWLINALADALSARQPTEDGEYMLKLIDTVKGTRSSVEIAGVKIMPCDEYGRTAAVPDAAPEGQVVIPTVRVRELREALNEARAERDAALAAVERCRGVLAQWEARQARNREILGNGALGHFQAIDCTGDLRAALDGAPEPEWEVQYGRRNRETGALHWLAGDPRDDWWHENQDRYEHVKRYTSPPLPVEGESK